MCPCIPKPRRNLSAVCSELGRICSNLTAWKGGLGTTKMSSGLKDWVLLESENTAAWLPIMRPTAIQSTNTPDISIRSMADEDRRRRADQGGPGTAVITKTKPQTKRPNMYRVLILNDDYTPMEFVVHVLERFFGKDHEAATRIMLHVHHHGIGECGVYTYEVAETKVTQVMDFARKHQHPLQCVMEKK